MRSLLLLVLAALSLCCAQEQSLQELADSLLVESPAAGDKRLKIPTLPGTTVKLLGCDYEQIITDKGNIRPQVQTDTPVRVCFTVTRGEEEVTSRDYEVTVPAWRPSAQGGNPKPRVIPDILQWQGGEGSYNLGSRICYPPGENCGKVAHALAADIRELFDKEMTISGVHLVGKADPAEGRILLNIGPETPLRDKEDYLLRITPEQVIINAATPQGLYWGTRTLLQILKQGNGSAPCGIAADVPRYPVRAFMLDVARLPVPLADLKTIIRTMAWYKMNELQLHLNDNYIFHEHYADEGKVPFKESYAAFRLESTIRGKDGTPLTAQDLHYSKAEFTELIDYARRHGVRIVPEFDTPGHALSFTRVRPELIYQGPMRHSKRRCEMLDAGNPEALTFATTVWDEYLQGPNGSRENATFANCPVVHIGADEFYGDKEAYRAYADALLRHVLKRGYTPRIWGSLHAKQGASPVVAKGVQMNLWSGDWGKAWASLQQGYDIINTDDSALYIVPFANYYRMDKNHRWLYENWQVNHIHGQIVPSGHPQLLGAMFAIWQDMSDRLHNGYTTCDYWPAISGSLDVLGERMWGQPTPPRSFEEHRALVQAIGPAPHADILQRKDASRKAFHLSNPTLPHALGLGSLGPGWRLKVELTLTEKREGEEQVLLSSPAGELLATNRGGCIGFRRADAMEFSFSGAKLPAGERVTLELIATPGNTTLFLNDCPAGTLTLNNGHSRSEGLLSTFILPLETLGESFHGCIHRIELTPGKP